MAAHLSADAQVPPLTSEPTADASQTVQSPEIMEDAQSKPSKNAGGNPIAPSLVGSFLEEDWDPAGPLASVWHDFGENGGVNIPVETSTTFASKAAETVLKVSTGELGPEDGVFEYSRHHNPTVTHLGRQLAALEGTEAGYCTASGMAAISSVLMYLTNNGDHIVASSRLYGGSYALMTNFLPKKGTTTTFVDITDLAAVERAILASPSTKVLYFESLSNPTLVVADIASLAEIGHRHGVTVVVDSTFAPMLLTPARLGADVVVHSITKFISGSSDLVAGCVLGPAKLISAMADHNEGPFIVLGPTMNPQVAFQISMRLPHLPLRMRAHGEHALAVATTLQQAGLKVAYPGLPSHPQHDLFKKMLNPGYGYGGMVTVDLGDTKRAYEFMTQLQNGPRFGYMAVSLGYHDTLMSSSGSTTSNELASEVLEAVGITPGLVRMSVGFSGAIPQRQRQLQESLTKLGYSSQKS